MSAEWNWLTSDYAQSRAKIVEAVQTFYRNDEAEHGVLKYYTIHNSKHCENVEDLIHKLIPDEASGLLTEEERYLLLTSAWLHDIGMLRSIVRERSTKVSELSEIVLREKHHRNSAWFVANKPSKCNLDEIYASVMANLCIYHRRSEDINRLAPVVWIGTKPIREQLLAAYLRLADALDLGVHRAPKRAYVMWLASDIPAEYRLHWIKNRLVTGINIDHQSKAIAVGFQKPRDDYDLVFQDKINYIITLVMQDLRQELSSVMSVLIRGGLPLFVDVTESRAESELSDQMIDDLRRLVDNYNIIQHPSASRLYQVLLNSASDIAGFKLRDTEEGPEYVISDLNFDSMNNDLRELQQGLEKLLKVRPHHVALRDVHHKLNEMISDGLNESSYTAFACRINEIHRLYRKCRSSVRASAKDFFQELCESNAAFGSHDKAIYRFLLYGYSELVIKALSGFRDALLSGFAPGVDIKELYGSALEHRASQRISIYICDGQSKTHTEPGDRLTYHDGLEYGLAFSKRKFVNITLIPDMVAGHVLKHAPVDMVLVGANGFTRKSIKHSAGHGSLIGLVREHRRNLAGTEFPKIVLATTSAKFSPEEWRDTNAEERTNFWITRDPERIAELERNCIRLYNPKHDDIPLHYIDSVITEKGWKNINPGMDSSAAVQNHISELIEMISANE